MEAFEGKRSNNGDSGDDDDDDDDDDRKTIMAYTLHLKDGAALRAHRDNALKKMVDEEVNLWHEYRRETLGRTRGDGDAVCSEACISNGWISTLGSDLALYACEEHGATHWCSRHYGDPCKITYTEGGEIFCLLSATAVGTAYRSPKEYGGLPDDGVGPGGNPSFFGCDGGGGGGDDHYGEDAEDYGTVEAATGTEELPGGKILEKSLKRTKARAARTHADAARLALSGAGAIAASGQAADALAANRMDAVFYRAARGKENAAEFFAGTPAVAAAVAAAAAEVKLVQDEESEVATAAAAAAAAAASTPTDDGKPLLAEALAGVWDEFSRVTLWCSDGAGPGEETERGSDFEAVNCFYNYAYPGAPPSDAAGVEAKRHSGPSAETTAQKLPEPAWLGAERRAKLTAVERIYREEAFRYYKQRFRARKMPSLHEVDAIYLRARRRLGLPYINAAPRPPSAAGEEDGGGAAGDAAGTKEETSLAAPSKKYKLAPERERLLRELCFAVYDTLVGSGGGGAETHEVDGLHSKAGAYGYFAAASEVVRDGGLVVDLSTTGGPRWRIFPHAARPNFVLLLKTPHAYNTTKRGITKKDLQKSSEALKNKLAAAVQRRPGAIEDLSRRVISITGGREAI